MANDNAPRGLKPVRHLAGGIIRLEEYSIASAYGTALGAGDPVQLTGTGKNIALSEAGNVDNIGVFAGCRYLDSNQRQVFSPYWPAAQVATEIVAYVYSDPNIVFEAQIDTIAAADVGNLIDHTAGTPDAATGQSTAFFEVANIATTGKSFRIIGLVPRVNNAYGAYAKIEVCFAEHVAKGVVAGVGGI